MRFLQNPLPRSYSTAIDQTNARGDVMRVSI